ncbi:unnamed protein product [Amoebophrya sp. A120]|nr:unnamed protein product [Amoebophrya sp. A120]|eukprot:GSA120T00001642001.1
MMHGSTYPYDIYFATDDDIASNLRQSQWNDYAAYGTAAVPVAHTKEVEERLFFKQRLTLFLGGTFLPNRFLTRAYTEARGRWIPEAKFEHRFLYVQRKTMVLAGNSTSTTNDGAGSANGTISRSVNNLPQRIAAGMRGATNVALQGTGLRNLGTSGSIWEFVSGTPSFEGQPEISGRFAGKIFDGLQPAAYQFGYMQWIKVGDRFGYKYNDKKESWMKAAEWFFYRYTAEDFRVGVGQHFSGYSKQKDRSDWVYKMYMPDLDVIGSLSAFHRPTIVMKDRRDNLVAKLEYFGGRSWRPWEWWFGGRKMKLTLFQTDEAQHDPALVTSLLLRCDADNASYNFLKKAFVGLGFGLGADHLHGWLHHTENLDAFPGHPVGEIVTLIPPMAAEQAVEKITLLEPLVYAVDEQVKAHNAKHANAANPSTTQQLPE